MSFPMISPTIQLPTPAAHEFPALARLDGQHPASNIDTGCNSQALPFETTLQQVLSELNSLQDQAHAGAAGLATGQTASIQEVAIDAAKAQLAFHFVLEMRNRLIATYQDVMRMQV